jgi:hypothetical protein
MTPGGPDKGGAESVGDDASGTGGTTCGLGRLGGGPCTTPGVGGGGPKGAPSAPMKSDETRCPGERGVLHCERNSCYSGVRGKDLKESSDTPKQPLLKTEELSNIFNCVYKGPHRSESSSSGHCTQAPILAGSPADW